MSRLGLAARGETALTPGDIRHALDAGIRYFNWPGAGYDDAIVQVARSDPRIRRRMVLAAQFSARTAAAARTELDAILRLAGSDYIDVLTYYYVEDMAEWGAICAPDGAAAFLEQARRDGRVRCIGFTSHQRPLAARIIASGRVDLAMVRYNAAHRGAESEVFPIAADIGVPVVAFTATRWSELLKPSPHLEPDAAACYRFVLSNSNVALSLMAPRTGAELRANLKVLRDWRGLTARDYAAMVRHGDFVHGRAQAFP